MKLSTSRQGLFCGLVTSFLISVQTAHAIGQVGIAAQYPGDSGIGGDSDVIFYEDFNDPDLSTLVQNWTGPTNPSASNLEIIPDSAPGSADGRALHLTVLNGIESYLYRKLPLANLPDEIFVRYYIRYPNGPYHHNGPNVGGYNPPSDYPLGPCCTPPDGDRGFVVHAEVLNDFFGQTNWPGPTHPFGFYVYWADMPTDPTATWCHDNKTYSNLTSNPENAACTAGIHFLKENYRITANQWTAVEVRLKLNTFVSGIPQSDGELEMFINGAPVIKDGIIVSRFEGFKWRTVPGLKANFVWINNHRNSGPPDGVPAAYDIDQFVVARKYVGPISNGGPVAPLPPTNLRFLAN